MRKPRVLDVLPALPTLALAMAVIACGGTEHVEHDVPGWVGDITTEGTVTTVVNESGSVWGGTATLVEEASIGVESGDDAYMLGSVGGVAVSDQYIYVVDGQVPTIRQYDLDGFHIRNFGREGQGPGEFTRPTLITVNHDGLVFVQDSRARRFNVFSAEGEDVGTWPAENAMCCAYPMIPIDDGTLWVRRRFRGGNVEERPSTYALQRFGAEGEMGEVRWPREPEFEAAEIMVDTRFDRRLPIPVPFSPGAMWVADKSGAIITGASDAYRFEVQREDDSVMVVEKYWEPVPIGAEEADWHRRFFITIASWETVNEDWTWDGAEMPATKPAFSGFLPAVSGEIWVRRRGPGVHLSGCIEDPIAAGPEQASQAPCWSDGNLVDAFGSDGRFLGEVETPRGMRLFPSSLNIDGDRVVGVLEDEFGTIMVKRWRLVLPQQ